MGAASTDLTTVVGADTELAATMTIIADLLATMIENGAHMDAVMTMALVESTVMPLPVVTIVIAPAETIVVAATTTMAETAVVQTITLDMASRRRQEILGILMAEVEPLTAVLMIGTPVDRSLSANLLRCGPLCQITPVCYSRASDYQRYISMLLLSCNKFYHPLDFAAAHRRRGAKLEERFS